MDSILADNLRSYHKAVFIKMTISFLCHPQIGGYSIFILNCSCSIICLLYHFITQLSIFVVMSGKENVT